MRRGVRWLEIFSSLEVDKKCIDSNDLQIVIQIKQNLRFFIFRKLDGFYSKGFYFILFYTAALFHPEVHTLLSYDRS